MFPHTITLYNVETIADPASCKDDTFSHITLLKGLLVDETKGVGVRSGLGVRGKSLAAADGVTVYIPFGVRAEDPLSGAEKYFLPAAEFWRTEDKGYFWTLSAGKQKNGSVSGGCFFIRGEAVHPEMDAAELEALYGGNLFWISSVDTKDFGGLQHWEVGAD